MQMDHTHPRKQPKATVNRRVDKDQFSKFRSLADQGDPDAQYEIGKCYRYGVGVIEDIQQAVEWFSKAGDQQHQGARDALKQLADNPPLNDTEAMFTLAKLFHIGHGVNRSLPVAIQLYELASELGHRDSPYYAGFIHEDCRRDVKKALHYYQIASSRGSAVAKLLHSLLTCSTPFSEGSAVVYWGQLELEKKAWLDQVYCLINDTSLAGFKPGWYEFLASLLSVCIEQENLDAWVPLSNKKARTAIAYFFLGAIDHITEYLPTSQSYVKTALAFAWADASFLPDVKFEQKFQEFLNLKPIFVNDPYIEKIEEAISNGKVDFALEDQKLNRIMYVRGDYFATLWGAKHLSFPPDTEVLRQCIKDLNRTFDNNVADPGGEVSAIMSLVSSFSPTDNERFFQRHRRYFREVLFRHYPLTSDTVTDSNYRDFVDWELISDNRAIKWSKVFIGKFSDRLSLRTLSANPLVDWDVDLLRDYEKWISNHFDSWLPWDVLSANPNLRLSREMIELYGDDIDWREACKNLDDNLLDLLFCNYPELLQWSAVSQSQRLNWNTELLEKFEDMWDWRELGMNPGIRWHDGLYEKYIDRIEWDAFSYNPNMLWSKSFVEAHESDIDWKTFSGNTGSFWTEEFIDRYAARLDFFWLSSNRAVPWTENLILRYESQLDWSRLSSNPSLPWSEDFLRRHDERLMWKSDGGPWSFLSGPGLSGNPALPWSHQLFDEYADRWNVVEVAKVYSGEIEALPPDSIRRLLNNIG